MTSITIPTELDIYSSTDDPSIQGDISIVRGIPIGINDCDSTSGWEVVSGSGVTITQETGTITEGTGSIKIVVPVETTAIVKYTNPTTSYNIYDQKYLSVDILQGGWPGSTFTLYLGETTYNQLDSTAFSVPIGVWQTKKWDISTETTDARDEITRFGMRIENQNDRFNSYVYVDNIYADPGPSQIKAYDGDRVINLYPKTLTISYAGDNTVGRNISLSRKGTPSSVLCLSTELSAGSWMRTNDMPANQSIRLTDGVSSSGRITAFGDGYFTVSTGVNLTGETYYCLVQWDD